MRPALIAILDRWGLHAIAGLVPTSRFVYLVIFVVFGLMYQRRAAEAGFSRKRAIDIWLIGAVAAAVGARAYYLVISRELFHLPSLGWITVGGTGSWGAYIGATLGVAAYCIGARMQAWPWIDLAASLAPLCEVIGRWSCWLAGDDFGRVTQVPWAIRFPQGSLAWRSHVGAGMIPESSAWSLPVHPEQFYLMANALLVFLVISAVWRRVRNRQGVTFAVYLLLFGFSRFWWEFFRAPSAGGLTLGLSSSQWMCIGFVSLGGILLAVKMPQPVPARA